MNCEIFKNISVSMENARISLENGIDNLGPNMKDVIDYDNDAEKAIENEYAFYESLYHTKLHGYIKEC